MAGGWRPRRQVREQGLEILELARELVATRDRFTRVAWARDRHSHPVALYSERAVRFCAAGALLRAEVALFGARNLQLDFEEATIRPARLEYAFAQLGFALGRTQMRKLGLVMVEADLLQELADRGAPLGALLELLEGADEGPAISWAVVVVALNEEKSVNHADILAGFDAAIASARRDLIEENPRRRVARRAEEEA